MSSEFNDHYWDAVDERTLERHDYMLSKRTKDQYQLYDLQTEIHQTDKAYLVVFVLDGKPIEQWLPKSQVTIPYADKVCIPDWLIKRIREDFKHATSG